MIELKPCPFCGGKAHVMKMGYPHWVYCEACGAKVHGGVIGENGEIASVKAWNTRTPSWILCSERMPEDGERILICVHLARHESVQLDTCIEEGGYMYLDSGYAFGTEVTRWMPLPEPPEGGAEK